jgi:hypothetical protein
VLLVRRIDGELPDALALAAGTGHKVDPLQLPAGLSDRCGELAERLLARGALDADRD